MNHVALLSCTLLIVTSTYSMDTAQKITQMATVIQSGITAVQQAQEGAPQVRTPLLSPERLNAWRAAGVDALANLKRLALGNQQEHIVRMRLFGQHVWQEMQGQYQYVVAGGLLGLASCAIYQDRLNVARAITVNRADYDQAVSAPHQATLALGTLYVALNAPKQQEDDRAVMCTAALANVAAGYVLAYGVLKLLMVR